MKQRHIFLLLISLAVLQPFQLSAQVEQQRDTVEEPAVRIDQIRDTLNGSPAQETTLVEVPEKYGVRVGIDLSKPLRTLFDEDYQGLEIGGDFRIYENYYLAAELGNEQFLSSLENITASTKGSYIKLGANYNAYKNWEGMQNEIYLGVRYGFATFSSELQEYSIYNRNNFFGEDIRSDPQEFSNLTAGWVEIQLGVKVEVLNNLFLGAHVQLKRRVNESAPNFFENLYIPGFGRTYTDSDIGTGYGYTISYLIPIYKN